MCTCSFTQMPRLKLSRAATSIRVSPSRNWPRVYRPAAFDPPAEPGTDPTRCIRYSTRGAPKRRWDVCRHDEDQQRPGTTKRVMMSSVR